MNKFSTSALAQHFEHAKEARDTPTQLGQDAVKRAATQYFPEFLDRRKKAALANDRSAQARRLTSLK